MAIKLKFKWIKLYREYLDRRLEWDMFRDACASVRYERRLARKQRRAGHKPDNDHVVSKLEIAKSWRRLYFLDLIGRGL